MFLEEFIVFLKITNFPVFHGILLGNARISKFLLFYLIQFWFNVLNPCGLE